MKNVYLAGSFKNLAITREIARQLTSAGVATTFSEPGDPKGIKGCLERIDSSDVLYLVNPHGEIGRSVALDIGYAIAKGKNIFSLNPVTDPPVSDFIRGHLSIEKLIAELRC